LPALPGQVDLAAGDGGVGDVHDHDAVLAGGGGDRPGVGAHGPGPPAPGGHGRAGVGGGDGPAAVAGGDGRRGVGGEDGHAAVAGGHAGEVGGGAEVVGVAHGHDPDAVVAGAAGGLAGGVGGPPLAEAGGAA